MKRLRYSIISRKGSNFSILLLLPRRDTLVQIDDIVYFSCIESDKVSRSESPFIHLFFKMASISDLKNLLCPEGNLKKFRVPFFTHLSRVDRDIPSIDNTSFVDKYVFCLSMLSTHYFHTTPFISTHSPSNCVKLFPFVIFLPLFPRIPSHYPYYRLCSSLLSFIEFD